MMLDNGKKTGTFGAMVFLVDSRGNPTSLPYHEIIPSGNGGYRARLGSLEFDLDEKGYLIEGMDEYPVGLGLRLLHCYVVERCLSHVYENIATFKSKKGVS